MLSPLTIRRPGKARAVAAWLAIAAVLGTLAGPAPARASCASRPAAACPGCHRAEPASASGSCAIARKPCCPCVLSSDPPPSAASSELRLDRPASYGDGLAAALTATGPAGRVIQPAFRLSATGPPGVPQDPSLHSTILRL